jgi:hypothetical protein
MNRWPAGVAWVAWQLAWLAAGLARLATCQLFNIGIFHIDIDYQCELIAIIYCHARSVTFSPL